MMKQLTEFQMTIILTQIASLLLGITKLKLLESVSHKCKFYHSNNNVLMLLVDKSLFISCNTSDFSGRKKYSSFNKFAESSVAQHYNLITASRLK